MSQPTTHKHVHKTSPFFPFGKCALLIIFFGRFVFSLCKRSAFYLKPKTNFIVINISMIVCFQWQCGKHGHLYDSIVYAVSSSTMFSVVGFNVHSIQSQWLCVCDATLFVSSLMLNVCLIIGVACCTRFWGKLRHVGVGHSIIAKWV